MTRCWAAMAMTFCSAVTAKTHSTAGSAVINARGGWRRHLLDVEALDTIGEAAGGGTDLVLTRAPTLILAAEVENLTRTGSDNFVGTGNNLANVITGGAGIDTLNGLAGNDTIVGGVGNDIINGGGDDDLFIWNNGDSTDTNNGEAGNDRQLINGAAAADIANVTATGGVAVFTRTNLVPFSVNMTNIERLDLSPGEGDDQSTVGSLTGTAVTLVTFDGGAGNDRFDASGSSTPVSAQGGTGNDTLIRRRRGRQSGRRAW